MWGEPGQLAVFHRSLEQCPRGCPRCLQTFVAVTSGGVAQAWSGQRPAMPQNIVQLSHVRGAEWGKPGPMGGGGSGQVTCGIAGGREGTRACPEGGDRDWYAVEQNVTEDSKASTAGDSGNSQLTEL